MKVSVGGLGLAHLLLAVSDTFSRGEGMCSTKCINSKNLQSFLRYLLCNKSVFSFLRQLTT